MGPCRLSGKKPDDKVGVCGATLETVDVGVSSNGTNITVSIEKAGGGDIDLFFNGTFTAHDTTPAATINLTVGTDVLPVANYVYIPAATNILTANTSGFPVAQHAPIGTFVCQSAASAQTDGVLKSHVWTDHLSGAAAQGHMSHINSWIRQQNATWLSGIDTTYTPTVGGGTATTVHLATTAGVVLQLHKHTFPALNTGTGSDIYIVNDPTTAYNKLAGLVRASLTQDSASGSLAGRYWDAVIWGVVSEDSGDCHYFLNLPGGSYGTEADAIADPSKYANFDIPTAFKGCGFLISQLVLKDKTSGGTLEVLKITDLRGSVPGSAGGGVSGAQVEFADNEFRVNDATDPTKQIAFEASGITPATTRTGTFPDKSGTFAMLDDLANPIATKINDYTMLNTDRTILADATSNTVAISLPASPVQGQIVNIKCINATFTCTIARNGKNIDGAASDLTLSLNDSKTLQYETTYHWAAI